MSKENSPTPRPPSDRGQGRKKVDDKKITFSIYPRKSRIDLIGVDAAKEIAINAIEKEYKKLKK